MRAMTSLGFSSLPLPTAVTLPMRDPERTRTMTARSSPVTTRGAFGSSPSTPHPASTKTVKTGRSRTLTCSYRPSDGALKRVEEALQVLLARPEAARGAEPAELRHLPDDHVRVGEAGDGRGRVAFGFPGHQGRL